MLSFVYLVVQVEFASELYSGSESSGEILVTIVITGGTSIYNATVSIDFLEETATG